MSRSVSGKPDQDLEGVKLLFHQKDGSAGFGTNGAVFIRVVWTQLLDPLEEQSAQISYMIMVVLTQLFLGLKYCSNLLPYIVLFSKFRLKYVLLHWLQKYQGNVLPFHSNYGSKAL